MVAVPWKSLKSLHWTTEHKTLQQLSTYILGLPLSRSLSGTLLLAVSHGRYLYYGRVRGQAMVRPWVFTECDVLNITATESDVVVHIISGWCWSVSGSSLRSKTLD